MSQPEKTGILYDQIIRRVIEDSRERFESEGADMQVLGELQKVSSVHGARRARARAARGLVGQPDLPVPGARSQALNRQRACARRPGCAHENIRGCSRARRMPVLPLHLATGCGRRSDGSWCPTDTCRRASADSISCRAAHDSFAHGSCGGKNSSAQASWGRSRAPAAWGAWEGPADTATCKSRLRTDCLSPRATRPSAWLPRILELTRTAGSTSRASCRRRTAQTPQIKMSPARQLQDPGAV